MNEILSKLWIEMRHNYASYMAALVIVLLSVWITGCESTTPSIIYPNTQVSTIQFNTEVQTETLRLQSELEILQARASSGQLDLQKQDALKQAILQLGITTAQAGTLNPAGLLGISGLLLGTGALIDNKRKDTIIKTLKP